MATAEYIISEMSPKNFQLIVISIYLACASRPGLAKSQKQEAKLRAHVVRQVKYWGDYKAQSLVQKVKLATPEVTDYLNKDNHLHGWPNSPFKPTVSADVFEDIKTAIHEIPKEIQDRINENTTAIMLVGDLGGSAYTERVVDEKNAAVAGFIILDVNAVNKTANEWATWKENSPFNTIGGYRIIATLEEAKNDNRKNAFQYILLHEMGHVLSINRNEIAPWNPENKNLKDFSKFGFTALSWTKNGEKDETLFDHKSFHTIGLNYYAADERKLNSDQIPKMYQFLQGTNFPTLYSMNNPSDDFAESFASYVHTERLSKPWKITISRGKESVQEFTPCWHEARCAQKKKVLEEILK